MKYALVDGEKAEATKGTKGVCPFCSSELIAKCGEVKMHHWSHRKKCTDRWWESETEWHRNWKDKFPKEWQEVIHYAEDGEKHIADVKTRDGWVVEFQHSPIKPEERRSRTDFYKKLVWVVDGKTRKTDIKQFRNAVNESTFKYPSPILLQVQYPWDYRLFKEWSGSESLVLLDFGDDEIGYRDGYSSNESLWLIYPKLPGDVIYLSPLSRTSFVSLANDDKFDEFFQNVVNPIKQIVAERIVAEKRLRR